MIVDPQGNAIESETPPAEPTVESESQKILDSSRAALKVCEEAGLEPMQAATALLFAWTYVMVSGNAPLALCTSAARKHVRRYWHLAKGMRKQAVAEEFNAR